MIVIGINAAPAGRGALRARLAQTHFERESMVNDGEGEINSGQSNFSHESPVVNLVIKGKEKDQSRHCLQTWRVHRSPLPTVPWGTVAPPASPTRHRRNHLSEYLARLPSVGTEGGSPHRFAVSSDHNRFHGQQTSS